MKDSKNVEVTETRIRKIPVEDWNLFKQHCHEESIRRGETVSLNSRLLEVIKILGHRTKIVTRNDDQPELDL